MKKLFVGILVMTALVVQAQPRIDSRIRTENYDKGRVYNINTMVGRATLIQLEEDESLSNSQSSILGIGDADAWNLGVRGNNIVLKPSQRMPQTNIVVVTNKRTYSFELMSTPKDAVPTYVLRFQYPDSDAARNAAEARRAQILAAAKGQIVVNTNYVWRGDNEMLKPTAAFDDGRFTRLVYDHGGELPVFFKVLPDGTEALLNSNVDPEQKTTVVLHEVVRTVRARMGNSVIEILNKGYSLPAFNQTGTSVPGTVRIDKGEKL